MATFQVERQRAKINADTVSENGFKGSFRDATSTSFPQGLIFCIPASFQAINSKIGDNDVQYTLVAVCDENGKYQKNEKGEPIGECRRFYPTMLTRTRMVYTDDIRCTGKNVTASGNVITVINSSTGIQQAMKALVDKPILVGKNTPVQTLRYGTKDQLTIAEVGNFNFLNESDQEKALKELANVQSIEG